MAQGSRKRGNSSSDETESTVSLARSPSPEAADADREQSQGADKLRGLGSALDAVKIGRYAVLERIGAGGMGAVYAAYDDQLDRKVAVKVLHSTTAAHKRARRLKREARALARLSHPNVVVVHEVGEWQGQVYVVMELAQGPTLATWQRDGERDWSEILKMYLQAGRGLVAAHEAGLVHRDFKPSNALIGEDNRVRVADFGLVRASEGGLLDSHNESEQPRPRPGGSETPGGRDILITATGSVLGTPAYMAPEQHTGKRADARADQFSFCVALYEALYGKRPFISPNPVVVARGLAPRATNAAQRQGRVPARVLEVLRRGLAARPSERWPSMKELLNELSRVAWPARRALRLLLMTGSMAIAVVAVIIGVWAVVRSDRNRAAVARRAAQVTLDAQKVATARALMERDPTAAGLILREVEHPRRADGWAAAVRETLALPVATAILRGHRGAISQLGILPDGRVVSISKEDRTVRTWHSDGSGQHEIAARGDWNELVISATGARIQRYDRQRALIQTRLLERGGQLATLDISPWQVTAGVLLSGGEETLLVADGVIRRWRFQGPLASVRSVGATEAAFHLFTRDGSALARGLRSGAIELWSTRDHDPPMILDGGPCNTTPVADRAGLRPAVISTDSRRIAAPCRDGRVLVWRTDQPGSPAAITPLALQSHDQQVTQILLSPNGRLLFTTAHDGKSRVWKVDEGSRLLEIPVWARFARFSPDSQRLALVPNNSQVATVVDLRTGETVELRGHQDFAGPVAFSADSNTIATTTMSGTIRLWRLDRSANAIILGRHDQAIWSAALSPDRRRLATAGTDQTARVWNLDEPDAPPIILRGHEAPQIFGIAFSPDGRSIATGANDGTARIWPADGAGKPLVLPGHETWAFALAFSPDNRYLATASKEGVIRLWPADRQGEPVILGRHHIVPKRDPRVHWVTFTRDGRSVLSAATNGTAFLWPTNGISEPRSLGNLGAPANATLSPDGTIIAALAGNTARLWSGDGSRVLRDLRGHQNRVASLAFSPDSQRLATVSADYTARVWSLQGIHRGERHDSDPIVLYGHSDIIEFVAFDESGRRLVTGSFDHTARVYSLDDPQNPIVLRGHTDQVRFVAFTRDGRGVLTASFDGTVRLWSLDQSNAKQLKRQLEQATSACLTADQRVVYLQEDEPTAQTRAAACARRP